MANDQQLPHSPCCLTGVTTPLSLQSKLSGISVEGSGRSSRTAPLSFIARSCSTSKLRYFCLNSSWVISENWLGANLCSLGLNFPFESFFGEFFLMSFWFDLKTSNFSIISSGVSYILLYLAMKAWKSKNFLSTLVAETKPIASKNANKSFDIYNYNRRLDIYICTLIVFLL